MYNVYNVGWPFVSAEHVSQYTHPLEYSINFSSSNSVALANHRNHDNTTQDLLLFILIVDFQHSLLLLCADASQTVNSE